MAHRNYLVVTHTRESNFCCYQRNFGWFLNSLFTSCPSVQEIINTYATSFLVSLFLQNSPTHGPSTCILSLQLVKMILKAVRVSDVPNHHDRVQEHATLSISTSSFTKGQILLLLNVVVLF